MKKSLLKLNVIAFSVASVYSFVVQAEASYTQFAVANEPLAESRKTKTEDFAKNNASDSDLTGVLNNVTNIYLGKYSLLTLDADSSVTTLSNGGTVAFSGGNVGRTLTIHGDYTGNNGLLIFNSVLSGDRSLTDRLKVYGNTSGTTRVSINNLGGAGDSTVNGIEVINVNGNSAGEFTEATPIVAGAYDYHLVRGKGKNSGNWYLTSQLSDGESGTLPGNGGNDAQGGKTKTYRPEGGAYAANILAANTMFIAPLSTRQGETEYTDSMTGERKMTSLWLKNTGMHSRNYDGSGQLKTQSNSYILMLGGDVAKGKIQGGSSWRLGALVGYANNHSDTTSSLAGRYAKGEVQGYNMGLYGTWYAQGNDREGFYIDTLTQYSGFNNTVSGEELNSEKYDADGVQASLESGYVFPMASGEQSVWYVQPDLQAAWSGIQADKHTENNGTAVTGTGRNNLRTQLGVKVFSEGHSHLDDGKNRNFSPFAEVSWVHNTEQYGANMDGVNVLSEGTRNIAEANIGVQGEITPVLNISGSVAQLIGDEGFSSTAISAGMKYTF
ncbi:autotransporter outer membrane beta-barrel domain-containing protein [Rahnella victoriana]|uniref:autotransporter outer membrane beta-barrel domain-containing protein n=1 Tax=Rahnella victoriana TaxID=1510570 RepID=UPI001E4CBDF3|nr:autotransporter outer membrane beta-barrel domain-containing protein [Rahnella victoriana]UHM93642.1 autotransporter outer membrane beta-barrel domain-containing protein [Rahnella victoriana]